VAGGTKKLRPHELGSEKIQAASHERKRLQTPFRTLYEVAGGKKKIKKL